MRNILYWLSILFLFASCKKDKTESKTEDNNLAVSNNRLLTGWKVFESNQLKVHIPSEWNPKPIKDALLYIPLNRNGNDLYYVVLNYNTHQIKTPDYIKKIFNEISKKDAEFTYDLKEIAFKNINKCYILELFTNEDNVNYKIYSLIYEVGNQIYDFSYKTVDDKKQNDENYQTFYTVLFSFEYQYDNVIDGEKFVIDQAKTLNYKDL